MRMIGDTIHSISSCMIWIKRTRGTSPCWVLGFVHMWGINDPLTTITEQALAEKMKSGQWYIEIPTGFDGSVGSYWAIEPSLDYAIHHIEYFILNNKDLIMSFYDYFYHETNGIKANWDITKGFTYDKDGNATNYGIPTRDARRDTKRNIGYTAIEGRY